MLELRQCAADKLILFLMVGSTDRIAGKTELAPSATLCKNGGAFAAPCGSVAEVGFGWYKLTPAAADTNTSGSLVVHATCMGADDSDRECPVVPLDPYDSASMGLSRLDTAVTSRATPTQIPDGH